MLQNVLKHLQSQQPIARIEDQREVDALYRRMRIQTMVSMLIGYAAFYLVRKNFSMAMPTFMHEYHFSKTDLGIILSVFSIIYGAGKFFNGMLADRANPRYFMAIGLLGAALVNVFFGFGSTLAYFGVFWLMNAYFQAMGWPPCARLLTHWYSPMERGTMWGIWNSSHQIGGALIMVLAGYLISNFGWRSAFYIPAVLALLASVLLFVFLRDTPQSLGLPPIEEHRGEVAPHAPVEHAHKEPFVKILVEHILTNKLLWYICLANFFVYIVRIGILDWAPTFLVEAKQVKLTHAGYQAAVFEVAGIVGALVAGILSDRMFKGRRGPASVFFMAGVLVCLVLFWQLPAGYAWLNALILFAIGFFIYGPQMLVGVAASDYASKKAVSTATGLTGTFGYMGSAVCGVGTGLIADKWGWNGGFIFFIGSAFIGMLLFLLTWHGKAVVED